MIILAIFIFVESNFIISISYDHYLWWQVINTINKSPLILLVSWGMLFFSIFLGICGGIMMYRTDRKAEEEK